MTKLLQVLNKIIGNCDARRVLKMRRKCSLKGGSCAGLVTTLPQNVQSFSEIIILAFQTNVTTATRKMLESQNVPKEFVLCFDSLHDISPSCFGVSKQ